MKKTEYKKLIELSSQISDFSWNIVQFWGVFQKNIIGGNLILALDRVTIFLEKAQNNKKRELEFLQEVSDQIKEAFAWLDKSRRRKIINQQDYRNVYNNLQVLEKLVEAQLK